MRRVSIRLAGRSAALLTGSVSGRRPPITSRIASAAAASHHRKPTCACASIRYLGTKNDGKDHENKPIVNSSSATTTSSTDLTTTSTNNLPAIPINFDIASTVSGQESQTLEVQLTPGQVLRAESGAMLYMTSGVQMNTTLAEGGLSAGFKRMLTGQNMFLADYTYEGKEGTNGTVGLGTDFPSKIVRLNLQEYGGKIICQKGAYLAGSDTVDIDMAFAKKFTAGFFGGEGFVLQSLTGRGDVFVKAGGTLVRKDLQEGESLRVSSGCLVAMTHEVDFDVQTISGFKNVVFGGEGLFVTTLTGPGTVWLQGMPADRMISEIARRVPSGGGVGLGIPLGVGGGGGDGSVEGADAGGDEAAAAAAVGGGADEAVMTGSGGDGESPEDMVAATDAAVDADRQATVASSGLDADSPSALFGDAAPEDAPPSASSPSSTGFEDEPTSSFSTDDTDDTSTVDFGEDTTEQQFDDFADDTQFSTMDEPTDEDFGGESEEFDTGDFGGDGSGGDGEGGGVGDLIRQVWDFFNSDE